MFKRRVKMLINRENVFENYIADDLFKACYKVIL